MPGYITSFAFKCIIDLYFRKIYLYIFLGKQDRFNYINMALIQVYITQIFLLNAFVSKDILI